MIPVFNLWRPLLCWDFTCNCLSYYLLSACNKYQVSHLTRYLEDTFPWNAGSPPTGSGVRSGPSKWYSPWGAGSCCVCEGLQLCTRSRIFPWDFRSFWICHRRIVSSILWQYLKARLLFSVFISFLYKIDWILKVLNFKRYGFILIYSVVLMGTDKISGQKVRENNISYLLHAVQTDLGSDLRQELHRTFPDQEGSH